ncbi:MAG: hypothetical protein V4463_10895 [Pseudomonadota bacterium]
MPASSPLQALGGDSDARFSAIEERLARVEVHLEHLQEDVGELKADHRVNAQHTNQQILAIRTTDFRILFGTIISVALGLTAVVAHGFHWI